MHVRRLLAWYRANHRKLPWRAAPGARQDPYAVWLSEVMLQQTTVQTVIPYFLKFMRRWPDFAALARAGQSEVMAAWAGLGYYSRARNLHACAVAVATEHGGQLPSDEAALLRLPGIGPYTAAAIAAIAFGRKAAPVDGNIERVLSRLMGIEEPLPASKPRLREIAAALAPARHAGDFAQAMMDLGATICTPKAPACDVCPWAPGCAARAAGLAAELPRRVRAKARPLRRAAAFVLFSRKDEVFLRLRPPTGLLAGMHETPLSPFADDFPDSIDTLAPIDAAWRRLDEVVHHGFTHFDLELEVHVASPEARRITGLEGEWAPLDALDAFALPTLFRKVIRAAAGTRATKGKGRRGL